MQVLDSIFFWYLTESPKGAGFDSPGRQPWGSRTSISKPQRGEIPNRGSSNWRWNLAPLGLARLFPIHNPGLKRPGLSNLAPLGLTGRRDLSFRDPSARPLSQPRSGDIF